MASATFGPPPAGQPVGHDASGHPVPYGSPEYVTNDLPVLDPAGANQRMSVGDWAKFVRIHMGQTGNGIRLLKPATLVRLHTPSFGEIYPGVNYAGGWGVATAGTGGTDPTLGKILPHDGSDGDWLAEVRTSLRHTTRTVPQLTHEHWYRNREGVSREMATGRLKRIDPDLRRRFEEYLIAGPSS